jgi:hypothetical protein
MAFLSIGLKDVLMSFEDEALISCKSIVQFSFAGGMPTSGTMSR